MCQRRTCPAALVLDQKKLVAFSVVAGRFLRFPIGDRRCNRTRASVSNAGGNARPSLTSATLAASRLLHGIPPSRSTEKSWPGFRPSAGAVNRHHGIGWEFVHVCIDDASRIAFVQVLTDQRKESAVAFLEAAVAHFAKLGVRIERVMTDNGPCYQSKSFRAACKRRGLRQIFTKPYTPKTNGKAERFIQTALREWAYARAYHNSDQRSVELRHWLHRYNWHRPHGSLKANTPISRLGLSEDNLLRLHT